MHCVLQSVTSEPIEAEMGKCIHPAMRERGSFERTLDGFRALGVFLPISDAVTTRVAVGIDINGNPEQVI